MLLLLLGPSSFEEPLFENNCTETQQVPSSARLVPCGRGGGSNFARARMEVYMSCGRWVLGGSPVIGFSIIQ